MEMKKLVGNIWDFYDIGNTFIVIPTNLGWKSDGTNVMGRGLAKQAAKRFPSLPKEYGRFCKELAKKKELLLYLDEVKRLILLPSKPLNVSKPWLSWTGKADIQMVIKSLTSLKEWVVETSRFVGLPLLGTGNGGLDKKAVLDITEKILGELENIYLYL